VKYKMTYKQTFSMKELPCEKVVVFADRAEVKRTLKATLKKGENELILGTVSDSIDQESVRVDGHGEASVLDVVCQNKTVQSEDKVSNEKINQLKAEIKELEVQRAKINAKLDRTNKQTQILNEFAANLAKPTIGKENASLNASSQENVNNFLNFMDTYLAKSESLDSNKYSVEKELENINEKLNVANENLSRLNYSSYNQQM